MRLVPLDFYDPVRHCLIIWQVSSPEAHWEWREMHGLNEPARVQYVRYMTGVLTGDFGTSFRSGMPVARELTAHLQHTLQLGLAAFSFSVLLALPVGIIAAIKRNTWVDKASMLIALIGISIPVMWLGILLVLFFSLRLGWLPSSGAAQWNSVILPGMALGYAMLSAMMLTARSSMLDIMKKDYIRTARAKGLSNSKIILKHALPNIIIPVLASFKANLGIFFTSLIVIEVVFSRPGIGRLLVHSVLNRYNQMTLACLIVFVFLFASINFAVDIIKAFADPVMRRGRLC